MSGFKEAGNTLGVEVVGHCSGKLVVDACRDWFELYKAFLCIGIKVGLWTSLLYLQRWFLHVGRWLRMVCATPLAFVARIR